MFYNAPIHLSMLPPNQSDAQKGLRPTDAAAERALSGLKSHYSLILQKRVRGWHAWLAVGLVAGIASGVILVANRSGELESGRAAVQSYQKKGGAPFDQLLEKSNGTLAFSGSLNFSSRLRNTPIRILSRIGGGSSIVTGMDTGPRARSSPRRWGWRTR